MTTESAESPQGAPVRPPLEEYSERPERFAGVIRFAELNGYALHLEAERERDARELESLREWKRIITHAPGEAHDHAVELLRASDAVQPIVAFWREKTAALEAKIARLRGVLARLQWCYSDPEMIAANVDVGVCPICAAYDTDGHAATCALAAALRSPTTAGTAQPVGEDAREALERIELANRLARDYCGGKDASHPIQGIVSAIQGAENYMRLALAASPSPGERTPEKPA